ncbi:F-box/LRR-repeat protein At5g02910-like [Silene latifolia]|uniref:F-box/LRR-repeat protein At5g02910-like n=1 Tax=Silene latifolia TaxID=37657 RepID=UPI003D783E28
MGENAICVDMISGLPDFILHQILSLLPVKTAAQTCVISKRWRHIWETFPIVDCCQLFFGKHLDIVNPKELGLPKDVRRKIFDQRVNFMRYVDEKLRCISENDRCVKKFRLVMTLVSVGLFPRVDFWMDLVSGLNVRELELCLTLGRERFYPMPIRVLASQSLTILSMKGCILIDCSGMGDLNISSLVELHLNGSFIDEESILKLVLSMQSLEVLSLKGCLGLTKLKINGHKKLKKVVYHPHTSLRIKRLSIDLPNLEECDFVVSYRSTKRLAFTDVVSPNLKRLSLCGIFIDAKSLRDIFLSFPRLEHLSLGESVVKEAVKLSSSILKEVYLRNCSNTEKAEFDTPGLQVFKYHSKSMSDLSLNSVSGNRIAELPLPSTDRDRSFFLELNNFLRNNKFQELILSVTSARGDDIAFTTENLNRKLLPRPFELTSMKLVIYAFTSEKYADLLDGLFENLHPKTLRLELNYNSPMHVKGLLKSLAAGPEPNCCQPENLKCWRHLLKGIKLGNVRGFQAGTPLDLCTLSSLNDFLDNWAIEARKLLDSFETVVGETLSFDLSW